jgi:hypothetical protein
MKEALESLKRRKQHDQRTDAVEADRRRREQEDKKLGDPGYRYRARMPRTQQPEYVVAPESTAAVRRTDLALSSQLGCSALGLNLSALVIGVFSAVVRQQCNASMLMPASPL